MKFNKFFPFAFIYFFFNAAGLPLGLTYMTLLGPFFYIWVLLIRKKEILLPFLTILLPFIIVHVFLYAADLRSYSISMLNIIMIYFFGQAVYTFLITPVDHEKILKRLLIINFIFCLVALAFYFTPYYYFFWIRQNLTQGVSQFLRLKLFTYEASYYAMQFVPLFFFFLLQYLLKQNKMKNSLLLSMLFLPVILSFSAGVISCLLLSILLTLVFHLRLLLPKRRVLNSIITLSVIGTIVCVVLFIFFRDNPVFLRLGNIFSGGDTSGQGRTQNAFTLALKILNENNVYWGIGPGQLKIIGEDVIRSFYLYYDQTPVAIPNAAAETLLLFGWVGFSLRFLIQLFLFFYTKVWTNYYRLLLFLFMFIYQFTGSFITNPAEYVIWILAFTKIFSQFDIRPADRKINQDSVENLPGIDH